MNSGELRRRSPNTPHRPERRGSVAIPRAISFFWSKVRFMRTEWTAISAGRPPAGDRVICFCRGAEIYIACWREGLDGVIEWISEYGIDAGRPAIGPRCRLLRLSRCF